MVIFGVVCPDRHSSAGEHGARGSSPFLLFPLRLVCTTRKSHFQLAVICESRVSWGGEKEKKTRWMTPIPVPPILDHLATDMRSRTCSSQVNESLPRHTPSDLKASPRACLLKALLRAQMVPETDRFKPSKPNHTSCTPTAGSGGPSFPSAYKDSCNFPRHPDLGLLTSLAISHSCHPMSIKLS